jgi:hypothetical protein
MDSIRHENPAGNAGFSWWQESAAPGIGQPQGLPIPPLAEAIVQRIVSRGGVFAPLEEAEFLRQVAVAQELGTIVWPNGADICPDLLHSWTTGQPVSSPEPEPVVS